MLLSKSIFSIAMPRNVQYGQNGVRGRLVRQIVEVEKQIGRGSVCCQMDQEALIYFAMGNQRKNQNVMKRNARVGKLGILECMFYVIIMKILSLVLSITKS